MKKLFLLTFLLVIGSFVYAQSPIGVWKTVDDETGKEKSHVQIYEVGGKLYGKIIKLLIKPENENCVKCKGALYNKPLIGLVIINGLTKDGDEWSGGTITDPKNGKVYKCMVTMDGNNKMTVRGYLGISLIGRSQYWTRIK